MELIAQLQLSKTKDKLSYIYHKDLFFVDKLNLYLKSRKKTFTSNSLDYEIKQNLIS